MPVDPIDRHRATASMGPRMFIRGIDHFKADLTQRATASMGPRMFIRGISMIDARTVAAARRFNGAADVHPRNRCSSSSSSSGSRASMGPRMFIRGIARARRSPSSEVRLQWGRGCSSAESDVCVETFWSMSQLLQWGRGCSSAESRFDPDTLAGCPASMGPRMFIRGNCCFPIPPTSRVSSFNGAADVHPRIGTRRGASTDERPASMGPRMFIRGIERPERYRCRLDPGFNGAADVHPRKHAIRSIDPLWSLTASMGPRMFIRGNCRRPCSSRCSSWGLQWGRGCSSAESRTGR